MAIELVSGLPGHGKTLWTVAYIRDRIKAEGRKVYVCGIPELKLEHEVLEKGNQWHRVPDGSIVVIDEAQFVFPKRGSGSAVPEHVSMLNTHRHRGIDMVLITQNPKLIDADVRALIDRHVFVKRHFGSHQAFTYTWMECRDQGSRADLKAALRASWSYPKDVFDLYKSATIHTVKRKVPWQIIAGLFGVPIGVALMVTAIWFVKNRGVPAQEVQQENATVAATSEDQKPESELMASAGQQRDEKQYNPADYVPRLAGLPHTAPAYDQMTTQPSDMPMPQACVQMRDLCKCFTEQGTSISDMPKDMCQNIVSNGYYNPYKSARREPEARPSVPSSSAPVHEVTL